MQAAAAAALEPESVVAPRSRLLAELVGREKLLRRGGVHVLWMKKPPSKKQSLPTEKLNRMI